MARGVFITLEGGEGVGKSTQLGALAEAIRVTGRDVLTTREPGGTPGAEAIRALLMSGAADRWSAPVEALLFSAARADHVHRLIRPALARGAWVVCDRFLDSTLAYQGAASGLEEADLKALHHIGSGGLLPDLTFLLTLPPERAAERLAARDQGTVDRMGARDPGFYRRVDEGFARLAAADPVRFRIVDADAAPEVVTQRLLAAMADRL